MSVIGDTTHVCGRVMLTREAQLSMGVEAVG